MGVMSNPRSWSFSTAAFISPTARAFRVADMGMSCCAARQFIIPSHAHKTRARASSFIYANGGLVIRFLESRRQRHAEAPRVMRQNVLTFHTPELLALDFGLHTLPVGKTQHR